jgi:hypothetical protein
VLNSCAALDEETTEEGGEAEEAVYLNDIGRNSLLGNRKKIAKFLMRTFTCRSTFLYAYSLLGSSLLYHETLGIERHKDFLRLEQPTVSSIS